MKIVSFKCVEFNDVDARVAVNLVPFETSQRSRALAMKYIFLEKLTIMNTMETACIKFSRLCSSMTKRPKATNHALPSCKNCIDIQRPKPKVAEYISGEFKGDPGFALEIWKFHQTPSISQGLSVFSTWTAADSFRR